MSTEAHAETALCAPHQRAAVLGLEIPRLGKPIYRYSPTVRHGDLLSVSGQISRTVDGELHSGVVGMNASVDDGVVAARVCALNLLSRIDEAVGLGAVSAILKLTVWVSSTADFTDQPAVAEAASALLLDVLGHAGRHSRTALPAHVLPKGALVELEAMVALRGDYATTDTPSCTTCRAATS